VYNVKINPTTKTISSKINSLTFCSLCIEDSNKAVLIQKTTWKRHRIKIFKSGTMLNSRNENKGEEIHVKTVAKIRLINNINKIILKYFLSRISCFSKKKPRNINIPINLNASKDKPANLK
jgi:hypothetical protein